MYRLGEFNADPLKFVLAKDFETEEFPRQTSSFTFGLGAVQSRPWKQSFCEAVASELCARRTEDSQPTIVMLTLKGVFLFWEILSHSDFWQPPKSS